MRYLVTNVDGMKNRWFGHVRRMDDHRIPRTFFDADPDGSRRLGQPETRWNDADV